MNTLELVCQPLYFVPLLVVLFGAALGIVLWLHRRQKTRVYKLLRNAKGWVSAREIIDQDPGLSRCEIFVLLGELEDEHRIQSHLDLKAYRADGLLPQRLYRVVDDV